jgi:hypothetical protein
MLKGCTDVAAAGPDHLARLHVPEIVQRDLEGRRNNIVVVQLKPDTAIADIAQGAREYAALLVGEQQCSAGILQPVKLPSFSHHCLRTDKKHRQQNGSPMLRIACPRETLTTVNFSATVAIR